jgi:sugar phosphate isomerase/epimerase
VRLAIENHDRYQAAVLVQVVESLGTDWVGVCLDTVNSFGALEGPEVVVAALAPYTLNLHLKDFTVRRVDSQMGFRVEGCPVGQGRLDVPWLLECLSARAENMTAIIELWTPPAQRMEDTVERERVWAEESVHYLRQFIKG